MFLIFNCFYIFVGNFVLLHYKVVSDPASNKSKKFVSQTQPTAQPANDLVFGGEHESGASMHLK